MTVEKTASGRLVQGALYHLAASSQWRSYQASGRIAPPSLVEEGFIHCSWGHQVPATFGRHFDGATDVLALQLELRGLEVAMVEEDLYGAGEEFPHLYGSVPVSAVTCVVEMN